MDHALPLYMIPYEQTLTQGNFPIYLKALVKLPFMKTDQLVEPNMITIRKKEPNEFHPDLQIWRNAEDEDSYTCGNIHFNRDDILTYKLSPMYFTYDKFTITLSHGVDFANPLDYI